MLTQNISRRSGAGQGDVMLQFTLRITKLKCPKCGGWCYVSSQKFEPCPQCGLSLHNCFEQIERYEDADITVTVNRLTGQGAVLSEGKE